MQQPRTTPSQRSILIAYFLMLAAIGLNALLYAWHATNPIIVADAWHDIDAIVRKAAAGQLGFGDLFYRHGAVSHAQPLRKLILLFHYRFFDLDYRIEAIVGVLAAFIDLAILWRIARQPTEPVGTGDHGPSWIVRLAFVALAAIYLSMNAPVAFNWPLLTLNYTSHVFVLLFLFAAWNGYRTAGPRALAWLLVAALAMNLVADDTGMVTSLAAILAIALLAVRERAWRQGGMAIATVMAAAIAYMLFYRLVATGGATSQAQEGAALGAGLSQLLQQPAALFQYINAPLVASIAHREHLQQWFGGSAQAVEPALTIVLVVAHVAFWWQALAGRRNIQAFVAIALMLVFYGLLGGMLLARVSKHGADYLWQPRYVLIYQWNLVALLLMAIGQLAGKGRDVAAASRPRQPRAAAGIVVAAAAALLLLQVPMSWSAWKGVRFQHAYQRRLVETMEAIPRIPGPPPTPCVDRLLICRYPPARRAEVIAFLQDRKLNTFSAAFRARHALLFDAGGD